MKILLVDDDQALLTVFSTALSGAGYQVITAENAKTGLDKVMSEHPDLVLLDQMLPDMNGNDVLKTLKQDPQTKDVPVAILSNYTDEKVMQESIQTGAMDYILKYQVEPKDLVSKVKMLLQEAEVKQPAAKEDDAATN